MNTTLFFQHGCLLFVPCDLDFVEFVIVEVLHAFVIRQPHAVVGVYHKQGVDRFTIFLDRNNVIAVAHSGVAVFVEEMFPAAVVGEDLINKIDPLDNILLVMISPDNTPGNTKCIQIIGQGGVCLRLICHGKISGDGDQIGLYPVNKGSDSTIQHCVRVIVPGIRRIPVALV